MSQQLKGSPHHVPQPHVPQVKLFVEYKIKSYACHVCFEDETRALKHIILAFYLRVMRLKHSGASILMRARLEDCALRCL